MLVPNDKRTIVPTELITVDINQDFKQVVKYCQKRADGPLVDEKTVIKEDTPIAECKTFEQQLIRAILRLQVIFFE